MYKNNKLFAFLSSIKNKTNEINDDIKNLKIQYTEFI